MPAAEFGLRLMPAGVVVSCEHAARALPPAFRDLVPEAVRTSHRGWDAGALRLAEALADTLNAPLYAGAYSRLLVDLNRSTHHRQLFSSASQALDSAQRAAIVARYYQPFRRAVRDAVAARLPCLHLSVHSFTPCLDGVSRPTDIGLLYDPRRPLERQLATALAQQLRATGNWTVHRNQPYRGCADGHTTALRRQLPATAYAGLEIEINQRWVDTPEWPHLQRTVCTALRATPWPDGAGI
ncbi:N-formylglutamate amidohydrolase [Algiphilus sp.]|uniref:N-formylglutamate amidohydrolase n=1 Tax=Algiphilus sp. TaxID=1872431 RepID=UPI0032EB0CFC